MSKKDQEQEKVVEKQLPKNPQEYSYRGDEIIPMPSNVFLLLYRALDAALKQGTKVSFPTVTEWVSTATGMTITNPNEKDIREGKVRQIMSVPKTFDPSNAHESFESWMVPEIIQAKDMLINIHGQAVEDGIATKLTDLNEERKAQAAQHLKEIVETQDAPQPGLESETTDDAEAADNVAEDTQDEAQDVQATPEEQKEE